MFYHKAFNSHYNNLTFVKKWSFLMSLTNGVNLQPSYYSNGDVDFAWSLMRAQSGIRTVRIEIEPDKAVQARGWIQQACGNGYAVIATYHKYSVLGSDARSELMDAAAWWVGQYTALVSAPASYTVKSPELLRAIAARFYGDPGQYLLIASANRIANPNLPIRAGQTLSIPARARTFTINIMNEWGSHTLTATDYANAYNAAIGTIRGVYGKPFIVDVPGWGQETAVAASAVKGYKTGGVKLGDTNLILSVHIYRDAFVQQKTGSSIVRSGPMDNADLDDLASAGLPCLVGEFGTGNAGSANWSGLVDHAKSLGWPVLGWAWNGDGGSMNMVSPSWPGMPPFTLSGYAGTILGKL